VVYYYRIYYYRKAKDLSVYIILTLHWGFCTFHAKRGSIQTYVFSFFDSGVLP